MVGEVESEIRDYGIGIKKIKEGMKLRIKMKEMKEKRRKELVKIENKYEEKGSIDERNVRREGMEKMKKMEKERVISKDERRVM